jgi:hypothetical protein
MSFISINKIIKALMPPGMATALTVWLAHSSGQRLYLGPSLRHSGGLAAKMDVGDECHVVRLLKEYGDSILDGTFLSRIQGNLSNTTSCVIL